MKNASKNIVKRPTPTLVGDDEMEFQSSAMGKNIRNNILALAIRTDLLTGISMSAVSQISKAPT